MTLVFQCFSALSQSRYDMLKIHFARSGTSTAKNSHGNPKHHEKLFLAEHLAGIVGLPHKKQPRCIGASIISRISHQTPLGPLAWTPDTRCVEAGFRATMTQAMLLKPGWFGGHAPC